MGAEEREYAFRCDVVQFRQESQHGLDLKQPDIYIKPRTIYGNFRLVPRNKVEKKPERGKYAYMCPETEMFYTKKTAALLKAEKKWIS